MFRSTSLMTVIAAVSLLSLHIAGVAQSSKPAQRPAEQFVPDVTILHFDGTKTELAKFCLLGMSHLEPVYMYTSGEPSAQRIGDFLLFVEADYLDGFTEWHQIPFTDIEAAEFSGAYPCPDARVRLRSGKVLDGSVPMKAYKTWLEGSDFELRGKSQLLGRPGVYKVDFRRLRRIERVPGNAGAFMITDEAGNITAVTDLHLSMWKGGRDHVREWCRKEILFFAAGTTVKVPISKIASITFPEKNQGKEGLVTLQLRDGTKASGAIGAEERLRVVAAYGKTEAGTIWFGKIDDSVNRPTKYSVRSIEFRDREYGSDIKGLFPPYKHELEGANEVRVRNPNDFDVTAGLRFGNKGTDFEVPANGSASVFVRDGRYDIYFIYSNKPDALFQGDSFTLQGNGVEIQIVKVVGGNYGIRRVK